jgi:hypothetical protein
MLGDEVGVESNRNGEDRYRLSLRGVGRRGELRKVQSPSGSGTSVRVMVKPTALKAIEKLDELIPIYAPTLPHDVKIVVDGKQLVMRDGWLKNLSCRDLHVWATRAEQVLSRNFSIRSTGDTGTADRELSLFLERRFLSLGRLRGGERDSSEERLWQMGWPEFSEGRSRLIASFEGVSILCLRGLAIQPIRTPGFTGVIELESAETDVSRSRAISADVNSIIGRASASIVPQVISALELRCKNDISVNYIDLLAECVRLYGMKIVQDSSILWISQIRELKGALGALS